jgi:hypothetical protein
MAPSFAPQYLFQPILANPIALSFFSSLARWSQILASRLKGADDNLPIIGIICGLEPQPMAGSSQIWRKKKIEL